MELVDEKLGSEFNRVEAERMIKVALLCTNASPSLRPMMSEVVNMLEGTTMIPDVVLEAGSYSQDLRFKAIRDHHREIRSQSSRENRSHQSTSVRSWTGSTAASANDLYNINVASEVQVSTSGTSWIGSSSTSGNDLYNVNLSSKCE